MCAEAITRDTKQESPLFALMMQQAYIWLNSPGKNQYLKYEDHEVTFEVIKRNSSYQHLEEKNEANKESVGDWSWNA